MKNREFENIEESFERVAGTSEYQAAEKQWLDQPSSSAEKTAKTPKDKYQETKERLLRVEQKMQKIRDQLTDFPDLLSKFNLMPNNEIKTRLRNELKGLEEQQITLKKSLGEPIENVIKSSKKKIDDEAGLYPEKMTLLKRLKGLFDFKTPKSPFGSRHIN